MEWFAGSLVIVAVIAWDAFRRWVDYRRGARLDQLELSRVRTDGDAALAAQALSTAAAHSNLVAQLTAVRADVLAEVRSELAPCKVDLQHAQEAYAATGAGFAEHVAVTKKAIANLVAEVKAELAPVKTDLSIYKQHIAQQQQRKGRIG
jgi:hypothetical protein